MEAMGTHLPSSQGCPRPTVQPPGEVLHPTVLDGQLSCFTHFTVLCMGVY